MVTAAGQGQAMAALTTVRLLLSGWKAQQSSAAPSGSGTRRMQRPSLGAQRRSVPSKEADTRTSLESDQAKSATPPSWPRSTRSTAGGPGAKRHTEMVPSREQQASRWRSSWANCTLGTASSVSRAPDSPATPPDSFPALPITGAVCVLVEDVVNAGEGVVLAQRCVPSHGAARLRQRCGHHAWGAAGWEMALGPQPSDQETKAKLRLSCRAHRSSVLPRGAPGWEPRLKDLLWPRGARGSSSKSWRG